MPRVTGDLRLGGRSRVPASASLIWFPPAGIVLILIFLFPITQLVVSSFRQTSLLKSGEFVGTQNYQNAFSDPLFQIALKNNLILLSTVPISIITALMLTSFVYRGVLFGGIYESLIFLPFLPSVAPVGAIFAYLLSYYGPINAGLEEVGGSGSAIEFLTSPNLAIWSIAGVIVWKRIGFLMLLFMARLQSLPNEIIEAAAIDGANWRQTFLRVVLPQARGTIWFAITLGIIEVFSWSFAYVYVMTSGGPEGTATYILEFLLYRLQFNGQVGEASALAVVLVVLAVSLGRLRPRTEAD